eukprot:3941622-Rhodomonas_salina.2
MAGSDGEEWKGCGERGWNIIHSTAEFESRVHGIAGDAQGSHCDGVDQQHASHAHLQGVRS